MKTIIFLISQWASMAQLLFSPSEQAPDVAYPGKMCSVAKQISAAEANPGEAENSQ
jgi:hypothetical protein